MGGMQIRICRRRVISPGPKHCTVRVEECLLTICQLGYISIDAARTKLTLHAHGSVVGNGTVLAVCCSGLLLTVTKKAWVQDRLYS